MDQVRHRYPSRFKLHRAAGFDQWPKTKKYKGRNSLHKLMIGTEKVKREFRHTQVAQLLMAAQEDSMPALKMDGRDEALSGLSDMKQVRVVCIE